MAHAGQSYMICDVLAAMRTCTLHYSAMLHTPMQGAVDTGGWAADAIGTPQLGVYFIPA